MYRCGPTSRPTGPASWRRARVRSATPVLRRGCSGAAAWQRLRLRPDAAWQEGRRRATAYRAAATSRAHVRRGFRTTSWTTCCSSTMRAGRDPRRLPARWHSGPSSIRATRLRRNQKTCYREALKTRRDIVVMLHPTTSTTPACHAMAACWRRIVRRRDRLTILGTPPVRAACRSTSTVESSADALQNLLLGSKPRSFHTGFRASRGLPRAPAALANSDDFVFDNQMLAQVIARASGIGEISCPRATSRGQLDHFRRSVVYGFGVALDEPSIRLWRWGLARPLLLGVGKTQAGCGSRRTGLRPSGVGGPAEGYSVVARSRPPKETR